MRFHDLLGLFFGEMPEYVDLPINQDQGALAGCGWPSLPTPFFV